MIGEKDGTHVRGRSGGRVSRRDEVEQQVMQLFLDNGFADITLDDVARQVQCSKKTLYSLAPSREQLIYRVSRTFFDSVALDITEAAAAAPDPRSKIRAYCQQAAISTKPASVAFLRDLQTLESTRKLCDVHTRVATSTIQTWLRQADSTWSSPGRAMFLGAVIANTLNMLRDKELVRVGMPDTEAWGYLGDLLVSILDDE